jgi:hypothetical protein
VPPNWFSVLIAKTSPSTKSWLEELKGQGKILVGTTLAFGFFRLMKTLGMDRDYVNTLETMDECATVVVFGFFLAGLLRRSFAELIGKPEERKHA